MKIIQVDRRMEGSLLQTRHFHTAGAAIARPLLEAQLHSHLLPRIVRAVLGTMHQLHVGLARGRRCGRRHGLPHARVGPETARVVGQRGRDGVAAGAGDGSRRAVRRLAHGRHGAEREIGPAAAAGGEALGEVGAQVPRGLGGEAAGLGLGPDASDGVLVEARTRDHRDALLHGTARFPRGEQRGGGGVGVEKGQEDGLLHQIVDESGGRVQDVGGRRERAVGVSEDVLADLTRHVDLAGGTRENVGGQQALPEHAHPLALGRISGDGRGSERVGDFGVGFPVTLGLQGEFQRLEAVVLGEIGHKGTEGVGGGGGVCEDLVQGRSHGTKDARGGREAQGPRVGGVHIPVGVAIRGGGGG